MRSPKKVKRRTGKIDRSISMGMSIQYQKTLYNYGLHRINNNITQ